VADLADLRDVATSMPRVTVARNGMSLRIAAVILLAHPWRRVVDRRHPHAHARSRHGDACGSAC